MGLENLYLSFLAGLFAPIGAVCVLPLYPGFLAYLAGQVNSKDVDDKSSKVLLLKLSSLVTLGVVLSMFLVGLIFTKFLQVSLTSVIEIVSPIAFFILGIISLMLIFGFEFSKYIPQVQSPTVSNPYVSSILFGLFFGIVVLPCNPASLVVLFAVSSSVSSFLLNLLGFVLFGVGMALPLFILGVVSAGYSNTVIGFLIRNKRRINLVAGLIMLVISVYYLIFVFKVFSFLF